MSKITSRASAKRWENSVPVILLSTLCQQEPPIGVEIVPPIGVEILPPIRVQTLPPIGVEILPPIGVWSWMTQKCMCGVCFVCYRQYSGREIVSFAVLGTCCLPSRTSSLEPVACMTHRETAAPLSSAECLLQTHLFRKIYDE